MKKITSEMLKNVGLESENFDEIFPNGMDINARNISTLNASLDLDIHEIIDTLLPIDISIEYDKDWNEVFGKFSESSRKFYDDFSMATFGHDKVLKDAMNEAKKKYKEQTKEHRKILNDKLSEIIDYESKMMEKVALKAFKRCKEVRCVGKTM